MWNFELAFLTSVLLKFSILMAKISQGLRGQKAILHQVNKNQTLTTSFVDVMYFDHYDEL